MNIGLLGCQINNENLGCQALTYSILSLLEDINKDGYKNDFIYYVFETNPDNDKNKKVALLLNIDSSRIKSFDITPLFRLRRFIHHFIIGIKTLSAMKKCDVFIDMTGGDSFTDIYGQYTFDGETNVKYLVKKLGKKLILGPQTYGPFLKEKNIKKAKRIIEKADLVISRDLQSKDYLQQFTRKKCFVTTDIAFQLPYEKKNNKNFESLKIGLNVSGLLIKNKTESTTLITPLMADYEEYIKCLIDFLLNEKKYEIHIIPHVGEDGKKWVKDLFGDRLVFHGPFDNPIDAKTDISQMDIFIGSRMHATIGAFSSGVTTIPVAYSRKFNGLFEHLKYPFLIDLCNMSTEQCFSETIRMIENTLELHQALLSSSEIWNKETMNTKALIKKEILS